MSLASSRSAFPRCRLRPLNPNASGGPASQAALRRVVLRLRFCLLPLVAGPRFLRVAAALFACLLSALFDAALLPSRLSAPRTALDLFADGFLRPCPLCPFLR